MYTEFFGLREKPFSLAPDPHFLFLAPPHREALAHILYGLDQGEGFIAITGEVGTGKTTLCRTLLQRLGNDTEVAFVFNPALSGEELMRAISLEFGLIVEGRSKLELHDQLNEFLLQQKREGRRVLLIVDESQNLSKSTLEEIRLLSNLETSTSKLIQILLFGQPELDELLDSKELRQLRQRITVRWKLRPLSPPETQEYVRHRLRIAAGADVAVFDERALLEVRRRTRGIPRLVNLLCDRSLLAGYGAGVKVIRREHVNEAAREILGASKRSIWRFVVAGIGAAALLATAGAVAWSVSREPATPMPSVSAPPEPAGVAEVELSEVGPELELDDESEPAAAIGSMEELAAPPAEEVGEPTG